MESFTVSLLNGLSYGLLLFLLSSGFTLIFGMMGVLNFAHASFYMVGAYVGYSASQAFGFWPALVAAPVVVALLGMGFERFVLRLVHRHGHVAELLVTFGLSYVLLEVVQLLWGRSSLAFDPPALLRGPAFTLVREAQGGLHVVWGSAVAATCETALAACSPFPATRAFMMGVALLMLASMALLLVRTRVGLVIRAALTHPGMVAALGHDVNRVFMGVFAAGAGLAGLAGVIGGSTFVTEPGMAAALGSVIFVVVVVGGPGSLGGALAGSLLIGLMQTFAVSVDRSVLGLLGAAGVDVPPGLAGFSLMKMSVAQVAPVLPYLLLIVMLVLRPRGLFGPRES